MTKDKRYVDVEGSMVWEGLTFFLVSGDWYFSCGNLAKRLEIDQRAVDHKIKGLRIPHQHMWFGRNVEGINHGVLVKAEVLPWLLATWVRGGKTPLVKHRASALLAEVKARGSNLTLS